MPFGTGISFLLLKAGRNVREDKYISSGKGVPNLLVDLPSSYWDENHDAQVQKTNRDADPFESQKGGVIDSFNNCMDAQRLEGEWSVEKVLLGYHPGGWGKSPVDEIPAWTSSAPPDLDEQKYDQGESNLVS